MSASPATEWRRGQQRERSKDYIVTLSDAEREKLTALIHSGKHPAQKLLKARILLTADASDGGEGWSDSEIAAAIETSVATVARTRQRLVEEGLEAALIRKHSPNLARRRIFDGAAEARLIALACRGCCGYNSAKESIGSTHAIARANASGKSPAPGTRRARSP